MSKKRKTISVEDHKRILSNHANSKRRKFSNDQVPENEKVYFDEKLIPVEIWSCIFNNTSLSPSDLLSCVLVCRYWYDIISFVPPESWRHLEIIGGQWNWRIREVLRLKRFRMVQTLKLVTSHITDFDCDIISTFCPHLSSFEVSGKVVAQKGLVRLAEKCSKLTSLYFDSGQKISDSILINMLGKLPKLLLLDLIAAPITDKSLQIIAEKCSGIEYLLLRNCWQITDKGLFFLSSCKNLEILCLEGCAQITNQGMKFLANGCSKLKFLDIQSKISFHSKVLISCNY